MLNNVNCNGTSIPQKQSSVPDARFNEVGQRKRGYTEEIQTSEIHNFTALSQHQPIYCTESRCRFSSRSSGSNEIDLLTKIKSVEQSRDKS